MPKQFVELFAQCVAALGIDAERERRFALELELNRLVAPHIAALARKRSQLLAGSGPERWSDELDAFLRNDVWPALTVDNDYAVCNRTIATLIVDVAIEREQRHASQKVASVMVGLVSCTDAGWAR